MTPREAALRVLADADAPLHWTVVLDRALRAGYLDPFTTTDVRRTISTALRELADADEVVRVDRGVYAIRPTA